MHQRLFDEHRCAIAASLERIGDRWSILILRECFFGSTHFDEFQKRLGIAPNILTRRLKMLVQEGLLVRREYSQRPPRFEYVLTERGHDFRPVLLTLLTWGNRHFAREGVKMQLIDSVSGQVVKPVLIDSISGKLLGSGSPLVLRADDNDESSVSTVSPVAPSNSEPSIFPASRGPSKEY